MLNVFKHFLQDVSRNIADLLLQLHLWNSILCYIMDLSSLEPEKGNIDMSQTSTLKRKGEIPSWFTEWIEKNCLPLFLDNLEHSDFNSAASTFFRQIEYKFQNAFNQPKNDDDVLMIMLSACYVVLFESLFAFESVLLPFHGKIPSHINFISFCCILLNLKNRKFLEWISANVNTEVLQAKYLILKNFIRVALTGDSAHIVCLKLLAEELGDSVLTQKAVKKLHSHYSLPIQMLPKSQKNETDIVCDGNIYDRAKDPPGQQSVYIPPGDPAKETYRLSTFLKFPRDVPVNFHHLAAAGFFYTGYKDRVKCFSCGSTVDSWCTNDDVWSSQWHRPDCLMARREDHTNVKIERATFPRSPIFQRPRQTATENGNVTSSSTLPTTAGHNRVPAISQQTNLSTVPAGFVLMNAIGTSGGSSSQMARLNIHGHAEPNRHLNFELATVTSTQHENVLRSLDLRKECDRAKTFDNWPVGTGTVQPSDLARSGFFYLGNLDRAQCFSCGGVLRNWKYGDDVEEEHKRHYPECRMLGRTDDRNVPLEDSERVHLPVSRSSLAQGPSDPSEAEQQNLQAMFPCLYPVNPHMRSEQVRFETFDRRWPRSRVNATPRQISNAGFFFLGERDKVKCWYCNGGLQNWDPDDEPWTEHAKWFPSCDFLLQSKGSDFVQRIVNRFPGLPRPILRSPHDVPPRQSQNRFRPRQAPSTPPLRIIDYKRIPDELRKAMASDIVKSAEELSFDTSLIRRVIKRKLQRDGSTFPSLTDLIDALTATETELSDSDDDEVGPPTEAVSRPPGPSRASKSNAASNPQTSTAAVHTSTNASSTIGPSSAAASNMEATSPTIEKKFQILQEERKCKICMDRDADIVFIPCGHLCCCQTCAEAMTVCPICRAKIVKAIRAYVS